ncbi:hypothetical protein SLEP1_g25029 [Rubroshorea leprosula]|uniref:Uncharacterized protein n=1 Tax=Rubroshorea leprosula TaxID=152421 RepID=A0AAV5JRU3_9ROSI|nr:hypothetical protein SLEP1_g25029 [Rubroshorea leprosula]
METSPKRKVKCSVLQRYCNGEENQEMGFDSSVDVGAVAVGNLEMVGFGVSSPKDGQETMETSPKKKFKRSVLHPDCNVAQNREVGFENAAFSDVISRSSDVIPFPSKSPGRYGEDYPEPFLRQSERETAKLMVNRSDDRGFIAVCVCRKRRVNSL